MTYKKLKYWFDKELAIMLAEKIEAVLPSFPSDDYIREIDHGTADLELKDRVEFIADQLFLDLGSNYLKGLKSLMKILGPANEEETGMFTEFYWLMPVAKYVEKYGLDHPTASLEAIGEITQRNTGEYAIRPFLRKHNKITMKTMTKWSKSKKFHLRRLASEGARPRLPWATKLDMYIDDPTPLIPILHQLRDDPSRYVQTSVANCMNDIIKDNPDIAKDLIEDWIDPTMSDHRRWIIRHALRKLRKDQDPWALDISERMK